MKRLILVTFLFFTTYSLAQEKQVTSINECMTDIYFGNGILTTKAEARENKRDLFRRYVMKKYGGLLSDQLAKARKEIDFFSFHLSEGGMHRKS